MYRKLNHWDWQRSEVLLETDVLVHREHCRETSGGGRAQQLSIFVVSPALIPSMNNLMQRQELAHPNIHAVV
jgi:hypothetical protein